MSVAPDSVERGKAPARTRIAIVGAGGIGGYYGAVLARAGHHVDLLARGDHLNAIRQRGGIEVRETPGGSTFVAPVSATDDPAALVGAPYTILAVKSYSLAEIAPTLRMLTDAGTALVPLLNGVDIADRLFALRVPRTAVLGGLAYVTTARTAPGAITRSGSLSRIIVGELDGQISERARLFAAILLDAGVEAEASTAIVLELWRKFAFLTTMAAVCGLGRGPIGSVRSAPLGRAVIDRAVREIVAVARGSGVPFGDDDIRRTLGGLEALPEGARPSFLADLERGGPTELEVLSGTVVRLARTLGLDTPVHDTTVAAISAQTGIAASS
jgi:2-dehydropantoate 2-reductase